MNRWHVGGAVIVSLLEVSCSKSKQDEKSTAPPPTSAEPSASPPDPVYGLAARTHFTWSVNATKPSGEVQRLSVGGPVGDIPIDSTQWGCAYVLEPWDGKKASHDESGWLSCALGDSGAVAKTMVLCQETVARPEDVGAGMLQVADKGAPPYALELSCRKASRESTTKRPDISVIALQSRKRSRLREKSGALHFQWKFDVRGSGPTPRTALVANTTGEIAAGLAAWKCSYTVSEYAAAGYTTSEIGEVACTSTRTGAQARAIMPCAESPEQPTACNTSSLVLTDEKGETRNIFMSCRGGGKGCWE